VSGNLEKFHSLDNLIKDKLIQAGFEFYVRNHPDSFA